MAVCCLLLEGTAKRECQIQYGLFPSSFNLNKPVATRLTTKVRERVQKQFITEIKMVNRTTSSSARDCNYCSLCPQMYGEGADFCHCYSVIKYSKWGKGRMPSYIRLFCYFSRSESTKKKEMLKQYQFFADF
jgi:hypothetical protein